MRAFDLATDLKHSTKNQNPKNLITRRKPQTNRSVQEESSHRSIKTTIIPRAEEKEAITRIHGKEAYLLRRRQLDPKRALRFDAVEEGQVRTGAERRRRGGAVTRKGEGTEEEEEEESEEGSSGSGHGQREEEGNRKGEFEVEKRANFSTLSTRPIPHIRHTIGCGSDPN